MHKEILSKKQLELLSVMSSFRREYYLVGGTAIALNLGHRRSIDVKVTFFQYPFPIKASEKFDTFFRLPSLLQLTAMKSYALGRRSKWKDYVDLYLLLKDFFTIEEISACANQIYSNLYSEKMFRAQLCYFEDVDYTEEVEYMIPNPPSNEEIRNSLTEIAQQGL